MTIRLTARHQAVVAIAAFTATGDMDRLTPALTDGLNAGLTVNEIREVLIQMYAYAGFPRSLNGLGAFLGVLDDRAGRGIRDETGPDADPLPRDKSRLELGTDMQTRLVGRPVTGRLFDFAPAIDAFLKDHLFGDIFGRGILDLQTREVATVAALACMPGVGAQLQAHIAIALNVGVTRPQIRGVVAVIEARVGPREAMAATAALTNVLDAGAGESGA
ncbi:MAG: 4-carboxymuconolactone decarboxylase [Telmatospirillum sp.]|nr:4-carboxymuconolactone decarboxylase [Telmatospirillum sp.]